MIAPRASDTSSQVVSVVIPVLNGAHTLPAQLLALASQDATQHDIEILVVDNGSTDQTREVVSQWSRLHQNVSLVDALERRGVSHARNVGVMAAKGSRILICDADDVVDPSWVSAMLDGLDRADLVGGGLELDNLNRGPERSWRFPPPPGTLPIALGFLPYAHGCNLGMHRHVFDEVQGWDENLVDGGDDIDFSWRAQIAGFQLIGSAEALVSYKFRDQALKAARQGFKYAVNDSRLYERFQSDGLRPRGVFPLFIDWLKCAVKFPKLFLGESHRGRWLYAYHVSLGHLFGRLRFRNVTKRSSS